MARKIRISAGPAEAIAELNDTVTAKSIWEALPLNVQGNLWGDEIYFSIPLKLELEKGQELVDAGDLGYWPQGSAFCIFYGPTPLSRGDEIRPASAVTVFGRVISDLSVFRQVPSGTAITIARINEE